MMFRRVGVLGVSWICLATILGFGCGGGGDRPRNLILITVDTLRADHLSYMGYERETSPRLDRLAAESLNFAHTFAPRGQTWPSLVSVMTGLYPISHGVRHNGEMLSARVPTLAKTLKKKGYRTGAFLTNYNGPNRGFEIKRVLQQHDRPQYEWDQRVTEEALEWLGERSGDEPFFLWLHLVSPHAHYDPPPPFDTRFDPDYTGEITGDKDSHLDAIVLGDLEIDDRDRQHIVALYDGEVAFVDALVGRVLDEIEGHGFLDGSVIAFLSDHGEELLEHENYMYHGSSIYDGVLEVPFLLRLPDGSFAGERYDGMVSLVDVLPTLSHALDLPEQERTDGIDLLRVMKEGDGGRDHVMAEWARSLGNPKLGEDPDVVTNGKRPKRIYAVRTPQFKYIYNPADLSPANHPYRYRKGTGMDYELEELYDIGKDPLETRNLVRERPDVRDRLREEIKAWLRDPTRGAVSSDLPDAETQKGLEALGYIEVEEREGE